MNLSSQSLAFSTAKGSCRNVNGERMATNDSEGMKGPGLGANSSCENQLVADGTPWTLEGTAGP